tara:strand:+ start:1356 stop:2237 length:882 start_codon:yes stop_codon:yes gene_type:complete
MTSKKNRIILVTGASRGVGKGVALGLSEKGDTVIITGRSLKKGTSVSQFGLNLESSLEVTAEEINRKGAQAITYQIDQNNDEEVKKLVEMVKSEYGRLDILVHASCQIHDDLVKPLPFWEKSKDMWSLVDVGLRSNYILSYYAAPLMIEQNEGLIVHISSHGARCYMHGPAYGAQKAGMDKMSFDMASDLESFNVASISLWSGIVLDEKTELVSESQDDTYKEFLKGGASQLYAGFVIDALSKDKEYMRHSGKVLIMQELGELYGIEDIEGRSPISDRATLGGPKDFEPAKVF